MLKFVGEVVCDVAVSLPELDPPEVDEPETVTPNDEDEAGEMDRLLDRNTNSVRS